MSDQIPHYGSLDDWTRDVRAVAGPPRDEHEVAHDGRVLDTREKMLAYLEEIGALKPKRDASA
jgi:hypothetical protein